MSIMIQDNPKTMLGEVDTSNNNNNNNVMRKGLTHIRKSIMNMIKVIILTTTTTQLEATSDPQVVPHHFTVYG